VRSRDSNQRSTWSRVGIANAPTPGAERADDETAVPRLADGTRVRVQSVKGLRIATHCSTIEQFIEKLYRFCEDSTVFIPNVSRSLGAVTPFSFELTSGRQALAGIGSVVEEFVTADNRFGRAGIVIALQQLGRDSRSVFDRALKARAQAREDRTPAPILARAFTAPIAIPDATTIDAPTPPQPDGSRESPDAIAARAAPADTSLPRVLSSARPAKQALAGRARTLVGIPISNQGAIVPPDSRVPIKVPAKIAPVVRVPLATPAVGTPTTKHDARAEADAIPTPLAADADDTIREERPWALRHALELDAAAPVAVSVQWSDELATAPVLSTEPVRRPEPPVLSAEPVRRPEPPEPSVLSTEPVRRPEPRALSTEPVRRPEPPVASDAPSAPTMPTAPETLDAAASGHAIAEELVDELQRVAPSESAAAAVAPRPVPASMRAMQWLAAIATLALLFAASTAATLLVVGVPSVVPMHQGSSESAAGLPTVDSTMTFEPVPDTSPPPAEPLAAPAETTLASDPPVAADTTVEDSQAAPEEPIVDTKPVGRPSRAAKKSRPRACLTLDCL
jgi:hypothetical protein